MKRKHVRIPCAAFVTLAFFIATTSLLYGGAIEPHILAPLADAVAGERVAISGLPLPDGRLVNLQLEPVDVVIQGIAITVNGEQRLAFPHRRFFRGVIDGEPASVVFVSAGDGELHAVIASRDRVFGIETVPGARREYRSRELESTRTENSWCKVESRPEVMVQSLIAPPPVGFALAPPVDTTLDIAIETDYELYQMLGSETAVANYAADLIGYSSAILSRDLGIEIRLAYLSTWTTSSDPWSGTDLYSQLRQLESWWAANRTSVARDAVHLISARALGGGMSELDMICKPDVETPYGTKGPYSVSSGMTAPDPTYELFLHEFGHTLGSRHTHCYVPPVDECTSGESGCYSGPTSKPVEGGTLMSYCPCPCGPPIFGRIGERSEAVLNLLRSNVASRTLRPILTSPKSACPGGTVTASVDAGTTGVTYNWTVSNGAITGGQGTQQVTAAAGQSGTMSLGVVVSRSNFCPKTSSSSIAILSASGLPIDAPATVCGGSTGNVASVADAGSAAVYHWTIANGTITAGAASRSVTFTAGASGSVNLNVTVSGTSCTGAGSKSIIVTSGSAPSATITAPDVAFAASKDNTASVPDAGAGATYEWSISNGWIHGTTAGRAITFGVNSSGVTTLRAIVRSANGCLAVQSKDVKIVQFISVTSATPSSGSASGYEPVVIQGEGFASGAKVLFGSRPAAAVVYVSNKVLTAMTPAGTGSVDLRVVNPDGGSASTPFTFEAARPVVLTVSPSSVPIAGGTEVVIDGTGFQPGAVVRFEFYPFSSSATSVTYVSSERLRAVTPAVTETGSVQVTVQNSYSSYSDSPVTIEFYDPAFRITGITPRVGTHVGGTAVTITGNGFNALPTVSFGTSPYNLVAATNVALVNSTTLSAITPSGWGLENVVLGRAGGGAAKLTGGYFFEYDSHITSITPASGPVTGGTQVTITGTGLGYGDVLFAPGPAHDPETYGTPKALLIKSRSDTQIVAITPPNVPGYASVAVSHYALLPLGFRYVEVPAILGLTPSSGSKNGGTVVTINGRGFQANATVKFGGAAATAVTVVNSTRITATAPPHAPGVVDVIVQNPDNSASAAGTATFEYLDCLTKPTATVSGGGTVCAGSASTLTVSLTGKSPWSVLWSDGFAQNGLTSATASRSVTPLGTTTYTITAVSDADCDGTSSGSATVTVKPRPFASISGPLSLFPSSTGNVITAPDAGAGATYSWSLQNGTITAGQGTRSITVSVGTTSPAVVSLTVTVAGCPSLSSRSFVVTSQLLGDADGDMQITTNDVFYLVNRFFAAGAPPIGNADANGDGSVDVSDLIRLIDFLFAAG